MSGSTTPQRKQKTKKPPPTTRRWTQHLKQKAKIAGLRHRAKSNQVSGVTPQLRRLNQAEESDEEPLNIREDWDSATIYVEPAQSEEIEVTFTRLKKRLKREDITLEKNKHFYRGVFEVAFGEHQEETKERIRELAKQDRD